MASITLFQADVYDRMNPTLAFLLVGFGLPGMLVMMQLAQLAPQVLASRHTKQFLDIPGGRTIVRVALGIELLGITECANAVCLLVEWCCCTSTFTRVSSSSHLTSLSMSMSSSERSWQEMDTPLYDVEDRAQSGRSGCTTDSLASSPRSTTVTMNPISRWT